MAKRAPSNIDHLLQDARAAFTRGSTSEEILQTIDAALAEAHRSGTPESVAKCLLYKANHYMIAGDYARSVTLCEEGLERVRGAGLHLEADLLVMMSRQTLANDVQRALELTTQAMEISAAVYGVAHPNVMIHHAKALGESGDLSGAMALLRKADAHFEIDDDHQGRVTTLAALCVQMINARQYAATVEYATELIWLAEQADRPMAKVNAFKFLAMALGRTGHLSEAFEVGQRALDLAEREFPGTIVGDCNGVLGDIYLELNDLRSALVCYSRALRVYRETGHLNGVSMCLLYMGETYARADEMEQAERLLTKASQLASEIGNTVIARRTAYARAGLYVRVGDRDQAEQILESVSGDLEHLDLQTPEPDVVDAALLAFRSISGSTTRLSLPVPDELDLESTAPPPSTPASSTHPSEPGIRVTLLGAFAVHRQGREISMEEWKRKKARDVFKFLAARHRKSVSVDEIVAQVWGEDVDAERCLPTLQNAVSAIRTALEPGLKPRQPSAFLQFRDGSYLLDLGTGSIDHERFVDLARTALRSTDAPDRIALLEGAAQAYSGEFLPDDRFEAWTDHLRGSLKDLAADVFHALAAAYFEAGNEPAGRHAVQAAVRLEDDGD